jgi:hypothetical protein
VTSGKLLEAQAMTDKDWHEVGFRVLQILDQVLVQQKKSFRQSARERGISPQQLAAAAVTGFVRERVEKAASEAERTTTYSYRV